MKRIHLTVLTLVVAAFYVLPLAANPRGVGSARFNVVEATITDIQKALQTRLVTSEQLVQIYLDRIAAYRHGQHPPDRCRRARVLRAQLVHPHQRACVGRGAGDRCRATQGQHQAANVWGADPAQGQRQHGGHADDRRVGCADRLDSAERCVHHARSCGTRARSSLARRRSRSLPTSSPTACPPAIAVSDGTGSTPTIRDPTRVRSRLVMDVPC